MSDKRELLKTKQRIVVKIGSSSLQHPETGDLDYIKLEKLVRELCDLRNQGKDVVLVTSGAIAVGKKALNRKTMENYTAGEYAANESTVSGKTASGSTSGEKTASGGVAGEKKAFGSVSDHQEEAIAIKQACSAVGQARLMMTYQKIFAEYNQIAAQILMTKNTIVDNLNRYNAHNTFSELLKMGVIPVVNENDTVATYEIEIGDNDTLSAIVAALVDADLLILLSDIDGLYTDDPRHNPKAEFIGQVDHLTDELMGMGKASTGSSVGTGGMNTKLVAAKIAVSSDIDMVIANSRDIGVIHRIIEGEKVGTLFVADRDEGFDLPDFVDRLHR